MGRDSFFWWVGVVEDRQDPVKLGRLRVRILGAHTEDKQLIPTCELHWAYVYQPITWNQAMNGLGHSPTGPAEGTWVWGFFKDNESAQDPIVLGVIAGIPEEQPQPSIGFYDPSEPHHDLLNGPRKIRTRYYPNDGTGSSNTNETTASLYPRQTHPWGCTIGESDVNRLARAENISDTIIGVRQRQRDNGRPSEFGAVPISFVHVTPGRKWVEPVPGYNAQYPYNHVYESESGHILEVDDTPNAERIHIYHRSGTYIEIGSGQEDNPGLKGDFSIKVVGKRFEVTMENNYSHYQNACNVTIDGETNVYCRSDVNLQVDGNMNVHVQGDYTEKVHGNYYTDIDGNRLVKIGGNDELNVKMNHTTNVGQNEELDVDQSRNVKIGQSDYLGVGQNHTTVVGQNESLQVGLNQSTVVRLNISHSSQLGNYDLEVFDMITEHCTNDFTMISDSVISGDAPVGLANAPGGGSPANPPGPGSPASPAQPKPPVVPPFPAPLGMFESRSESAPDPVCECQPDPNPALNQDTKCGPIPDLPDPVPCPDGCAPS